MISTKTVDWKIFQGGDNFLVAINLIYLVVPLLIIDQINWLHNISLE